MPMTDHVRVHEFTVASWRLEKTQINFKETKKCRLVTVTEPTKSAE